jgi:hypothetical protein
MQKPNILYMSESEIFLEYNGHIDLPVIELLLKKLKKTKGFTALNKTTGKRVYAIVVECLENISKHPVLQSAKVTELDPHISIRNESDKIIITAGNPVPYEAKENLVSRLDQINFLDETGMKNLYENIITSESKQGESGAGLGLIFMALKSGNKLSYSFNPVNNSYLYFEIQISLNKYIMRKLIIDQTSFSPKVILDPEKKIYLISGESRPPDVREFYDQIIKWLDEFTLLLIKSDDKKDPVTFNFNFEYFNSSSGKLILDICKILAGLRSKGFNGREISKIVKFPFEYIESGVN